MLNRIIKVSFSFVGGITGLTTARTVLRIVDVSMGQEVQLTVYALAALMLGILFFFIAHRSIPKLAAFLDSMDVQVQRMSLGELAVVAGGAIAGLLIANLVMFPVNSLEIVGLPLSIAANILFGTFGMAIALRKRGESVLDVFRGKKNAQSLPKLLDTSAIIDGRIVDVCRAGFIEGELIIPTFVLEELRHIADSQDPLKRAKGRRGLDILNVIQKELKVPVRIDETATEGTEVDDKLLKLARKLDAKIVTNDYNLNKVAALENVPVVNLHELANAVKPMLMPGEEMMIQVVRDGKERGQGIGYLSDGTMIVIEDGKRYSGETIGVVVTSVIQTAAGRMVFGKPKAVERAM